MTTLTNKQLDQQRSEYRIAQRILLDIETAKLLRVEDVLGQIKPGMLADIIAFQKNPIEDISTVENVSFVMKDGIVFKQTP